MSRLAGSCLYNAAILCGYHLWAKQLVVTGTRNHGLYNAIWLLPGYHLCPKQLVVTGTCNHGPKTEIW